MVAAAAVFGVSLGVFLHGVAHTDARFQAAGIHRVELPAHVRRGLYGVEGEHRPGCTAVDGTGAVVAFHTPDGQFTFDQWRSLATFDTGDGHLTFRCSADPLVTELRVGRIPGGGDLARLGLVGIGLPLLLGGTGFLVVLVTGIMWATRRAPRPAPFPAPFLPPGTPYDPWGGRPPGPPRG